MYVSYYSHQPSRDPDLASILGASGAATGVYVLFHDGCSRAEWSQVGSEVNYNRCRYAVLHKGQVGMYQVGSPTLGQLVGADDIEKAAVGWDVLKIAKLVDLKVSLVSHHVPIGSAYLKSVTWLSVRVACQRQSHVSSCAHKDCLVKVSHMCALEDSLSKISHMCHHVLVRTADSRSVICLIMYPLGLLRQGHS